MLEQELVKYPRTPHHPLSGTIFSDDKVIKPTGLKNMYGKRGIFSYKMDGESATIYPNGYTHARATNSAKYFPYQAHIKRYAAEIGYKIPSNLRLCGENMTTVHKVKYEDPLPIFLGFSVWEGAQCLSWDETLKVFNKAGVECVDVVYDGIITEEIVSKLWRELDKEKHEGLVCRLYESFDMDSFEQSVFKLVRKGFDNDCNLWNPNNPEYNKLK
ncbi:RNA ligase family protein [Vibrio sp. D431a]|uniref:RNA ligase family protein n=1 Tax=Vibrio sp. D431a TaxID=2837388 RepID=UPI0025527D69|nr:RNA ligase family protein [Vibrio sp. D431a]MDK9790097.1 hypothetical protein [Vibrio sp. D431a]